MPRSDQQLSPTLPFARLVHRFLADRAVRKPSSHTTKAYRQDFEAIAILIAGTGEDVVNHSADAVSKDNVRAAFAAYASTHSVASIRRCWSTWNSLCNCLFTAEVIEANPVPLIGRPKVPKTLPKSYPAHAITDLIAAIDSDYGSTRASDWAERDRAIVFTSLLAGLRADELLNANVGDIRRADGGDASSNFSPTADHLVGADGDRMTRGTLQYRILRAFKRAGINGERANGALVHGLRHTFATELANANVSVYTLMKLLGHESMVTSQRYVDGAGTETRAAAALNLLHGLLKAPGSQA
ncbi:site-specific recombinase XerD (plasmid) [Mycolicibacterium chubuense NBB4]|uniref:Site-specific recombinase XerD n=1 Tax=Mycolicibacterium chubuense (strain NBB4) TaxID=710421 RepID=I4BSK0_MYCCN|nr:tyrosine-type recombinase/integrase [Mycolicibacterium chubuense]AFM20257.1 site-specific recombinase XerD [Mycolicibacterium chubuense NBB4]